MQSYLSFMPTQRDAEGHSIISNSPWKLLICIQHKQASSPNALLVELHGISKCVQSLSSELRIAARNYLKTSFLTVFCYDTLISGVNANANESYDVIVLNVSHLT